MKPNFPISVLVNLIELGITCLVSLIYEHMKLGGASRWLLHHSGLVWDFLAMTRRDQEAVKPLLYSFLALRPK
jgi:hypothetical protein